MMGNYRWAITIHGEWLQSIIASVQSSVNNALVVSSVFIAWSRSPQLSYSSWYTNGANASSSVIIWDIIIHQMY